VETIPPFFGDKTKVSVVLSVLIDWDLAGTKGTGTEVIKWAQFGKPGQPRIKPPKYDHGYWHDGARVAFLFFGWNNRTI
jgi:hypothetical protein